MVNGLEITNSKVVGKNYQLTIKRPDGTTIEILVPIKPIKNSDQPFGLNLVFAGDHYE